MKLLSFGPRTWSAHGVSLRAREDVERRRQPELDDRVPELVVHRVVVVGVCGGMPGSITPRRPEALIASRSRDPVLGRAQRGLAHADEPVRRGRAELGDPLVVRVEARVLVVDVGVVAQHHADRRVDDLGGDAVGVLVGEARDRDPSRRGAGPRSACRCRGGPPRSGRPAAATSQNGTSLFPLSIEHHVAERRRGAAGAAPGRGTSGRCGRCRCPAAR